VFGEVGEKFLTSDERDNINKGVAHLTERLSLDPDSEIELQEILKRSMPVLSRLVSELRKADADQEAAYWLDRTDALIEHAKAL
jgi:hypothetical protein